MKLGLTIKNLRVKRQLTQTELSEQTGITLRTIQRIENGEVKPSLHSLKVLSKALEVDLSALQVSAKKPYEFEFKLSINDMNQFINDLKILVKTHWKTILLIVLVIWLVTDYTDIKSGIMDGWNNR
jgi:transcriptional regulator with XRE-family HTH domain